MKYPKNPVLQILADGGLIDSNLLGASYENNAATEKEYLKDKKTSTFTRIGAGIGAAAVGAAGVIAAPFTGGASVAAAIPLATSLGKHAIGGKPERGQDNDPLKDLGVSALTGAASGAMAYAGAGGAGSPETLSNTDWSSISQGVEADDFANGMDTSNLQFEAVSQFKCGGKMYANGGSTSFTTTEQSNGLIVLEGFNHGEGGIDLMDGIEVEGGETIYNDFVFTDSHIISFETARMNNLPQGSTGKTFAAASKHYAKYMDERPDDPYAKESFAEHMARLEEAHLQAVPQSRPENIGMGAVMSNAMGQGIPAKNGGKIMWYVNSVPFKNGGPIKFEGGGETYTDPTGLDQDTSDRAYTALETLMKAQFPAGKTTLGVTPTQDEKGNPGLRRAQYEDGMAADMARLKAMPVATRNPAMAQILEGVYQTTGGFSTIPEGTDLQVLDLIRSGYPLSQNGAPIASTSTPIVPPPTPGPAQPLLTTYPPTAPNTFGPTQPTLESVRDLSLVDLPQVPQINAPYLNVTSPSPIGRTQILNASDINQSSPFSAPASTLNTIPDLSPEQMQALTDYNASANKKLVDDAKPYFAKLEADKKKFRNERLREDLRYAPLAGDLAALATTAFDKPELIAAEQFLIKQDYKKQTIDKELLQREADQQTADLAYQLSGLATTQAGMMAGLAGISAGTAKAKTDAVMKGQLFDAEQGQIAEQYARQKEMANSQTMLQVQNMNDANSAIWSDSLSDSITNLTQNIGAIGKDEMNKNIANKLGAYNIYGQYVNPEMAPLQDVLGLIGNLNEAQQAMLLQGLNNKKKKSSTTTADTND